MKTKKFIALFIFLFIGLFAFSFNASVKANYTTSDSIQVIGAQVRTIGNQGLRFIAYDEYEGEKETSYGIILAFGETEANENFVIGGTVNGKEVANASVTTTNNGVFMVTLYDIPEVFFTQLVSARAYVVDGSNVVYSDTVCVRSLAQIALLSKNDNVESELIDDVITSLEGVKKSFVDPKRNFYVNDALYETNYSKLAIEFIKDWNECFDTELNVETAFSPEHSFPILNSATGESPTKSGLYKFFIEGEYADKWSWLLDFFANFFVNKSPAMLTINAIKNGDDSLSSNIWNKGRRIVSFISSTFLGEKVSTGDNEGFIDFTENPDYLNRLSTFNTKVYADLRECEILGAQYTLPEFESSLGYQGCYDYNDHIYQFGLVLNTSKSNLIFVATELPIDYTVQFYANGELLDELETTYNIEESIELPTYVEQGYVFEGWYDNEEFEGDPITSIDLGNYGNKVFYAKMVETDYNLVTATFDMNYIYTYEEFSDQLLKDIIAATGWTDINTKEEYSSLNARSYISDINKFIASPLSDKYTVLVDYLISIETEKSVKNALASFKNKEELDFLSDEQFAFAHLTRGLVGGIKYKLKDAKPTQNYGDPEIQAKIVEICKPESVVKEFILPSEFDVTPERKIYSVVGWKCNRDGKVYTEFPGYLKETGVKNVTYTAQWELTNFKINYNLDGARTNDNPSTYTYEDETIVLNDPHKVGYIFVGWTTDTISEPTKALEIPHNSRGEFTFNAVFEIGTFDISFDTKGNGEIDAIRVTFGDYVELPIPENGNYPFDAWYYGESRVVDGEWYLEGNITLVAKWYGITYVENEMTYVDFGRYPQTIVDDPELIEALNNITHTNKLGYIEYHGDEYKKAIATPYNERQIFSNGQVVENGKAYYFKVESIKWRVLENNNGTLKLYSEYVLYSTAFYRNEEDRIVNGNTIYCNNYAYSNIRAWLNGLNGSDYQVKDYTGIGFIDVAFNDEIRNLINDSLVDNSASTTSDSENPYACENTIDKLYLLSYQDLKNPAYGFGEENDPLNELKLAYPSDYALTNKAFKDNETGANWYYLRSPYNKDSRAVACVYDNGLLSSYRPARFEDHGVRPALEITIK